MRKFTKEHNDLDFLFPDIKESGEWWFDYWEKNAERLFNLCHTTETTFTKDDLIDAFMKGASESQRTLILRAINAQQFAERLMQENQRLLAQNDRLMHSLIELKNK